MGPVEKQSSPARVSGMRFARVLLLAGMLVAASGAASVSAVSSADLQRGRYLVGYGSCNDCHTPGWIAGDGTVPVSRWLTGTAVGFRGPWGTVYPTNLRLRFAEMSEANWLFMIRTRGGHPPMKWTDLRTLSVADQRAIYRFVRSLGPAGTPAPADVPPEQTPHTPVIDVIPVRP